MTPRGRGKRKADNRGVRRGFNTYCSAAGRVKSSGSSRFFVMAIEGKGFSGGATDAEGSGAVFPGLPSVAVQGGVMDNWLMGGRCFAFSLESIRSLEYPLHYILIAIHPSPPVYVSQCICVSSLSYLLHSVLFIVFCFIFKFKKV